MPDHRQNHGEQVTQRTLVLAPETSQNGGRLLLAQLGHEHHQFLGFSGVDRKKKKTTKHANWVLG